MHKYFQQFYDIFTGKKKAFLEEETRKIRMNSLKKETQREILETYSPGALLKLAQEISASAEKKEILKNVTDKGLLIDYILKQQCVYLIFQIEVQGPEWMAKRK